MAQTETQTQGNPSANPAGTSSPSQGSEFDRLLAEFEQRKQSTPEIPESVKPVVDWANGQMQRQAKEAFDKDVTEAVGFMKEAEPFKAMKDRLIRGALHDYALENPDFDAAFRNRQQDPKEWHSARTKAREALLKELVEENKGTDIRSDIEAATAAVRNSQSAPSTRSDTSPSERLSWSDTAWEAHKRKRLAGA